MATVGLHFSPVQQPTGEKCGQTKSQSRKGNSSINNEASESTTEDNCPTGKAAPTSEAEDSRDRDTGEPIAYSSKACDPSEEISEEEDMIDRDRYSKPLQQLIDNDPRLLGAAEFVESFNPTLKNGEYNWITVLAPKLYDSKLAVYQKLDDKAASVVTWIVAAAGLLATGTIVGVCEGKVHWLVALATIPTLVLASLSIRIAVNARLGRDLWPVPDIKVSVDYTNAHAADAEIMILGQWHLAIESVSSESNARSVAISSSLNLAYLGLVCLAIPLMTAISMQAASKNSGATSQPTTPFATSRP